MTEAYLQHMENVGICNIIEREIRWMRRKENVHDW